MLNFTGTNYVVVNELTNAFALNNHIKLTEFAYKLIEVEEDNVVVDRYYQVLGLGTITGTEITVPDKYRGIEIREVVPYAFKNNSYLTKIHLGYMLRQLVLVHLRTLKH